MMSTKERGRMWGLEIFRVFADSTVFKQWFYCSFLWIGGGGCTIVNFYGCLTS